MLFLHKVASWLLRTYADAGDAAVQADVDANEADSDAADAALQAAIDANAAADAAESAAARCC